MAFPPARSISFTIAAAASAPFVYVIATFAPSLARRLAIAAPIPRDPPVTSAALFFRFAMMIILIMCQHALAFYEAGQNFCPTQRLNSYVRILVKQKNLTPPSNHFDQN